MELGITFTGLGGTVGLMLLCAARRIARDNHARMSTALRVWLKWERTREY